MFENENYQKHREAYLRSLRNADQNFTICSSNKGLVHTLHATKPTRRFFRYNKNPFNPSTKRSGFNIKIDHNRLPKFK